jgi:hypothetical protein
MAGKAYRVVFTWLKEHSWLCELLASEKICA